MTPGLHATSSVKHLISTYALQSRQGGARQLQTSRMNGGNSNKIFRINVNLCRPHFSYACGEIFFRAGKAKDIGSIATSTKQKRIKQELG